MKARFPIRHSLLWAAIACLSFVPATASILSLEPDTADCDSDGECNCPAGQDCGEAGGGWNPTFICPFGATDTLGSLLECLADGFDTQAPPCSPTIIPTSTSTGTIGGPNQPQDLQQNPPDSNDCNNPANREDFVVTPLPGGLWGLNIVRLNGSETDRLIAWESMPGIKGINIRVNREGLVARLARFTQQPSRSGGSITINVNGHSVILDTGLYNSADGLDDALVAAYDLAGFTVVKQGDYIYITEAPDIPGHVRHITDMSLVSTDRQITDTAIALLPVAETGLRLSVAEPLRLP